MNMQDAQEIGERFVAAHFPNGLPTNVTFIGMGGDPQEPTFLEKLGLKKYHPIFPPIGVMVGFDPETEAPNLPTEFEGYSVKAIALGRMQLC